MAYSEKDLTVEFIPGVRYANGNGLTLSILQDAILSQTKASGIPVAFREEQLRTGTVFNPGREKILIMYNPEHESDYMHFAIRIQNTGNYAFVNVFNVKASRNIRNDNIANEGNTFRKITNALGGHAKKLQQEEMYYCILSDCVNAALEGKGE